MNYMDVPIGAVIPFLFDSFSGSTGASITMTGLATSDIKILKGTALTAKPTPTSGVALLDGDGTDLTGGGTGIHGFSIDTGNTTDSGYFAIGSYYNVIVDSIAIDAQTVRFIAGAFRLVPAETQAGYQKVDAQYVAGAAPETGAVIAPLVRAEMDSNSADFNTIIARLPSALVGGRIDASVGAMGTDVITSAAVAASAVTEIQTGLGTAANQATIIAKTNLIPASPAAIGDAMSLTSGERNAIADAHLNRTDGITTGYTPARTQRALISALAGKVSKSGNVFTFRNVLDTVDAIVATTTVDGERTAVTVSIS